MPHINQKMLDIINNYLCDQNFQLLKIIAKEENLDFNSLVQKYISSRSKFNSYILPDPK